MAILCEINDGYVLECSSVGGVEQIWIGTYSSTMAWTLDNTAGITFDMITGATNSGTAPNDQITLHKIEQRPEFAEFNQGGVYSVENGTTGYETTLKMKFIHLENTLRQLLLQVGRAPIVAIIKTVAGDYFVAGVKLAGYATEGTAGAGKALTDLNGAELTITWKSQQGSYLIDMTQAYDTSLSGKLNITDDMPILTLPNI